MGLTGRGLASALGVDCRIQVVNEGELRTIAIVGHVLAEHVPGLLAVCGPATRLRLDMSEVLAIDAIAADALRRIRDGGAQLVGVPPYIQFKLDSIPSRPPGV